MKTRHIIFTLLHVALYTFVISLTFYAIVLSTYIGLALTIYLFKGGNKHVQLIQKEKDLS